MKHQKDGSPRVVALSDRWVDFVWDRGRPIAIGAAVSTLGLLAYVATHLGFNLDNRTLIDPDLPFQRAAREMARHFPELDDALLVVVDADTAELCRSATAEIAAHLAAQPELYRDVFAPAALPFFARNALLYRTEEEIWTFSDRVAEMQPLLAELARAPTIASLTRVVRLGLEQEDALRAGAAQWALVLDRIGDATVEIYHEYPVAVSWEDLMLAGSGVDVVTRQVIVVDPVLHFDRLLAADAAISRIRAVAQELDLTPERGVRVRVTGNPALNYDEMIDLAWDVGIGGVFSFVLILGVLFVALRSFGLVLAAVATLLAGLVWTAAFATVAVGSLNVLSITFGLLFIGLGVDFPLHLGMHYAARCRAGVEPQAAMRAAGREVAPSLVLCALTTAIGFLAFVPTDYRGVSELGLIAAAGMFVVLMLTLTLFPAIAHLTRSRLPAGEPWSGAVLVPARVAANYPKTTVVGAIVFGAVAFVALPRLGFDSDVVSLRNPETESVRAFRDLLEDTNSSPWSVDVLAPDLPAAEALAGRLEALDVVGRAVTAADYVPTEQEEKRAILADAAFLLDTPEPAGTDADDAMPVAEQVAALRALHTLLSNEKWRAESDATLHASVVRLRRELDLFLDRIARESDPEAALVDLERVLLGNFAAQLTRLDAALEPEEVTLDSLPAPLRRRLLSADGMARVQVFSQKKLEGTARMEEFVDGVLEVAPQATGVAANLVAFARATSQSMYEALTLAGLAIALLLLLLQRSFVDLLLILAPVTFGLLMTAASMVVLGIQFNFVNVVVLPLLLGVGVDSGIHLVRRARAGGTADALPRATAGAVFYSALTTIVGFGSLGFSDHFGIASMGWLLVIGMIFILLGNLVLLPALLRLFVRNNG